MRKLVIRKYKKIEVAKIKKIFCNIPLCIILNIHNMLTEDIRILRKMLKKNQINIRIFKNTLVKLANKNNSLNILENDFKGQIALIWDNENKPTIASLLRYFHKKITPIDIKCGFHNGKKKDIKYIEYLSNIPNLYELRCKILGIFHTILKTLLYYMKYQLIIIMYMLKKNYMENKIK